MTERLKLIEQQLDEREDEAMALKFAFMTLVKLLDERGVLPLRVLADRLGNTADTLRVDSGTGPHDLVPVAEQVDSLRDALLQLR